MILTADYHTHTPYSHGKNTVDENAAQAKALGLKQLGTTDHGFAHMVFPVRRKEVEKYAEECKVASGKYGIDVLTGVEANILSVDGKIDFLPSDYENFDILLCGTHICVWCTPFSELFTFCARNYAVEKLHLKKSKKLIDMNTRAYINTIKNNPIDVLTHVNYLCKCNSLEVAKAASDYGTYLELNSKKTHFMDDELMEMVQKTDVRFVIDSDAHSASRIGDTKRVEEQLKRLDFPLDRIDNIDGRLPKFRFAEVKSRL
jgi:putative hydrolase